MRKREDAKLSRARKQGFTTLAEYEAARSQPKRETLLRKLAGAIRRLEREKRGDALWPSDGICWLWNKPGLSRAAAFRVRYAVDHDFQMSERIRRQINKRKKRDSVAESMRSALNRWKESNAVQNLLGYTIAQLRQHLERQFTPGMNWAEFLAGRIHIDHITPQAAFDLSDDEQWRKCWCLSNLRPLWAKDNLAKSAHIHFLI